MISGNFGGCHHINLYITIDESAKRNKRDGHIPEPSVEIQQQRMHVASPQIPSHHSPASLKPTLKTSFHKEAQKTQGHWQTQVKKGTMLVFFFNFTKRPQTFKII